MDSHADPIWDGLIDQYREASRELAILLLFLLLTVVGGCATRPTPMSSDSPLIDQAVLPDGSIVEDKMEEMYDKEQSALALDQTAGRLANEGKLDEALKLEHQALTAREKIWGPISQRAAATLVQIGSIYEEFGHYSEAEATYRKALSIAQQNPTLRSPGLAKLVGDPARAQELTEGYAAAVADALASVLYSTGRVSEAEELTRNAVDEVGKVLGPTNIQMAPAVGNVGAILFEEGDMSGAEKADRQALAIVTAAPDSSPLKKGYMSEVLGELSETLRTERKFDEAEQLLVRKRDLDVKAAGAASPTLAGTYAALGLVVAERGRREDGERLLSSAYYLVALNGSPQAIALLADALDQFYAQTNPAAAIFFGKQAVNQMQIMRTMFADPQRGDQMALLEKRRGIYAHLADNLIDVGRLPEAEMVLRLMKEDELFLYLRRDAQQSLSPSPVKLTAEEQAFETRYENFSKGVRDALALPGANKELAFEQGTSTARAFFESLKEDLGPLSGTEVTSVASEGREALSSGMLSRSQKSQRAAILVHYFVSGERVRVLVVSTSGDAYRELDITAKELNQRVAAFRQKLLDPKSNPRPEASALYDSIIRPIAGELRAVGLNDRKCHERKGASPGTLLVSLDGSLRYIPIGALFDQDCQEWLIEKVSIAVYASGGGGDLGVAPKSRWTVGAFGVSKATTIDGVAFPALTSVPDELASIVRDPTRHTNGILPGTEFLDDQFTKEAFAHATEARYSVVHIATHLSFSPTEDTSFLVIGGGQKLSIAELRKSGALDFRGVDLVTVSACDSALDAGRRLDGREIESFAALAQERGAKAVMASLWSVADPSTAALMGKFYKLREEMHIPKVDALREVQREFIRGGAKEKELVGNDGATAASKSPASGADWSHPYYWAPFVVLGNWL